MNANGDDGNHEHDYDVGTGKKHLVFVDVVGPNYVEGAADETATRLANESTTTQRTMIGDDVTPMTTTMPSPVLMVTTTTTPLSAQSNSNANKSFIAEGEVLRIDRISRYDMGFYMCIASNGVPPSVSQRIFLPVSCKYSTRM